MPQGLQTFDAAGNLLVDLSTRLGRVLGLTVLTTQNGSFSDPAFAEGTPFVLFGAQAGTQGGDPWAFSPNVVVSGTTLSWDWGDLPLAPISLIYGVY